MNFGGFATPERNVIFDINDLDETLPAPWEWDLKRLAASVVIAAQHLRLADSDAARVATDLAREYRKRMTDYASMRALDVWYDRIDMQRYEDRTADPEIMNKMRRLGRDAAHFRNAGRGGHAPVITNGTPPTPQSVRRRRALPGRSSQAAAFFALVFLCACAQAQVTGRAIQGANVQKLANGIVGVMSYTVAPDVTTSSLAISNTGASDSDLSLTQLGGGFTWSKSLPLYLEGNAAYSRYDPVFVVSDGAVERQVPTKWNSFSATGGIGWDFPLSEHWVIRPIFNFTLGRVVSDLKLAKFWADNNTDLDLAFLDGGKLNVYGLGGSLMLDYEKFAPEADDDIEIRYTKVDLQSHGSTSLGVVGRAKAESVSLWARRRVPTGWGVVWDRPVRYVYEVATTRFLGNETDVGLTQMSSVGFGLELDSSALDRFVTRWRALARYKFGPQVRGWALGLAVSF